MLDCPRHQCSLEQHAGSALTPHTLFALTKPLRDAGFQLYPVPGLDLVSKHLVDEPVLLDDGKSFEAIGGNIDGEHCATAAGDVLDLSRCATSLAINVFGAVVKIFVTLCGSHREE